MWGIVEASEVHMWLWNRFYCCFIRNNAGKGFKEDLTHILRSVVICEQSQCLNLNFLFSKPTILKAFCSTWKSFAVNSVLVKYYWVFVFVVFFCCCWFWFFFFFPRLTALQHCFSNNKYFSLTLAVKAVISKSLKKCSGCNSMALLFVNNTGNDFLCS